MRYIFIILFLTSHNILADLGSYKFTCEQIGFKVKTEEFGKCVLELRKKDKIKQQAKETAKRKQANEAANRQQANEAARRQQANEAARRQQANEAARRQQANEDEMARRQQANEAARIQQAQTKAQEHFAEIQRQNAAAQRRYQAELASYRRELAAAEKARAKAKKDAQSMKLIELGLGIASGKYEGRGNSYRAPNIYTPAPPPLNPYSRYRMTFPDNSYIDCTYNSQTRNADCY